MGVGGLHVLVGFTLVITLDLFDFDKLWYYLILVNCDNINKTTTKANSGIVVLCITTEKSLHKIQKIQPKSYFNQL